MRKRAPKHDSNLKEGSHKHFYRKCMFLNGGYRTKNKQKLCSVIDIILTPIRKETPRFKRYKNLMNKYIMLRLIDVLY